MIGCVKSFHQVDEGHKGWQVVLAVEMEQGLQRKGPVLATNFRGCSELGVDTVLAQKETEALV